MHVERDTLTVSAILAAWVLLYGHVLNILDHPFGMAACGASIVLVMGHIILIRHGRKGIPFVMAYVAYIILTLFSLTRNVHPAVEWASEFLVLSVLSVTFVAFYDIFTKANTRELLPQLVLLYALAIALLGAEGWVLIALLGLATALVCSMRSLIGYMMSLVFVQLPFIGAPAVVYNIGNFPHIVLPGFHIGSVAYVTALVITYIASSVASGIGGMMAMTFWRSLTKLERIPHVLLNSLSIAVAGVIFDLLATVFIRLFIPWIDEILFIKTVALTLTLTFVAAIFMNTVLFRKEIKRLLKEFEKQCESILYELDNVREAVNALASVGVDNEKVEELHSRINGVLKNLSRIKKRALSNPSPSMLRTAFNELSMIKKEIAEIEKETIDAFASLITTVQSLKPIIDPYVKIPEDLWLKAVTATKVNEIEDIIIKANALRKLAEKLCKYLEKATNQSLTELGRVLGINVSAKEQLKCSNWRNPISALREIVRKYSSILAENKDAVQETYSKLLKLKEAFLLIEKDIERNNLQSTNFGVLLSKASTILSEVPDVIPSTHSAIHVIKRVSESLREVIAELPKALKTDLNSLLGEPTENNTSAVASVLHAFSDVSERLSYFCETLQNLSKKREEGSYAQLIATYESELPKLLRRIVDDLRELAAMRRRAGLIPLVMEYIDYLIKKKGGTLSLEELPFKRDASVHFVQLYALSKGDVEVWEEEIRVKGGERNA